MNDANQNPSHAGGVVFRNSAHGPEYLLVRARKPPAAWVFPKGHIEKGETPETAAIREVLEEAGVHALIIARIGELRFDTEYAEMFLMAYQSAGNRAAERGCAWLSFDAALASLSFEESRALLKVADQIVRTLS
jgi:8-oxo-dGTP pyrophosphatase MutT (NUDIX family)